jgi:DegV family protein with EDD domain
MSIKIITDTTAGLPSEFIEEYGITVMPQIVMFGEKSYRDDTDLDTRLFLEMMLNSPELPQTSAPPPEMYIPFFERFIVGGYTILVIAPTAEASGTVRSAITAAQRFPQADIRVYDSRTIAGPMATMVMQAARWIAEGQTIQAVLAGLDALSARQRTYFIVATLEYLRRGGRIGGAQALIGRLLEVKPILTLKDGRVEPFESQRTYRRALHRLQELVLYEYPRYSEGHLSIMHADAQETAEALAADLAMKLDIEHVRVCQLPPAIVVHAGPGVIAAGYFLEEEVIRE